MKRIWAVLLALVSLNAIADSSEEAIHQELRHGGRGIEASLFRLLLDKCSVTLLSEEYI